MLSNIRIVLVSPSHPGNIGATARAMKTMGLSELCLVSPKIFPHVDATARAAGADDLLAHALITDSFASAIADCTLVIGTSARIRALPLTRLSPKDAALKIVNEAKTHKVAVVFGRENNGLSNEELDLCNYHIRIPTDSEFSSLNIAAAVQIITYEIKMALEHAGVALELSLQESALFSSKQEELASSEEIELFYRTLTAILIELEFLNPENPSKLMRRIRRLFNRVRVEKLEFNILMGILTAIKQKLKYKNITH